MDFFVSKVALSICALLVITILSGVTDRDRFMDDGRGIEIVLQDFCDVADRAFGERSEGIVLWKVPVLSTGNEIELTLDHGVVHSQWEGISIARQPQCYLHTWRWDGSALNESTVGDLDKDSGRLTASSGESIILITVYVLFENDHRLLVFASPELH
jgi:hypothetical protein